MTQQINLFNPLFLRQEKYFSARTMLQALALIVIGLGAFYAYGIWQTRALGDLVARQGAEVAHLRSRIVTLSGAGAQNRIRALQEESGKLESAIKAREALLEKLRTGDLGNSEGVSRYFAAFAAQDLAGVWLTGFTVGKGGNELRVRGRALAPDLLPAYLQRLSGAEVMRGRKVVALELTAGAAAKPAAGTAAGGPARFVDFSFTAPLQIAEPGAESTKEAAH
ncbi:MAG: MSHA biogenesis protein MshI [Betaproteobacteria bacterium]|nr:MSHA biogenesis protein MshI [Betaproteobacteria bacterium]